MDVKVLGPGCARCTQTEKIVTEVIAELGLTVAVEKVTDIQAIARHGVFGTPAVVIDGKVKSVGKVPTREEVKSWIAA